MSEFTLPEGMTATGLRIMATNLKEGSSYALEHNVADRLNAWADVIDPPTSIVTDEMIDEVADEVGWVGCGDVEQILQAVERLGWLRDPDARAPSGNDEPWPTDEQVLAAAKAAYDSMGLSTPWESASIKEWRIERARAALEAVAPPPIDGLHKALMDELRDRGAEPELDWDEAIDQVVEDAYQRGYDDGQKDGYAEGRVDKYGPPADDLAERLEMAERLLRRITIDVNPDSVRAFIWLVGDSNDDSDSIEVEVDRDDAEYLDLLRRWVAAR